MDQKEYKKYIEENKHKIKNPASWVGYVPNRIEDGDLKMRLFSQNILFGRYIVRNGENVLATALYNPDRASLKVEVASDKSNVFMSMDYYNDHDRRAKVVMAVNLSKDGARKYEATKYFEDKWIGTAEGLDDWERFFIQVSFLEFVKDEKVEYNYSHKQDGMDNLEELNKWASNLSLEEIKNLPEEKILEMAMERPGHPGQYGFMLQLQYFKSTGHLAKIMRTLLERIDKVDNLKEKMRSKEKGGPKAMKFTGDEYIQIVKIAEPFWKRGISKNPPDFAIVMGGVGSGKTTLRRQKFADGYVNFDFGEIYNAIKKTFGEDNPKLADYTVLASDMILRESLENKKNIIIEIIGENKDLIDPLISKMKDIGYEISLEFIDCDPAEAYKRHLKAVKEDPEYLSAHFTQEATLSFFYQQLELGEMPVSS